MRSLLFVLSLSLIGCGTVHTLADASNGSGTGADANPRGTVKVTTYDPYGSRTPTVGTPVVFIDAAGAVVATVPSDGNGKAQADMLPGGTVTAVWQPTAGQYILQTVEGVKPGDDIALIGLGGGGGTTGTFTLSWPAQTGASYYQGYSSCYSGYTQSTSVALSITDDCRQDTMTVAVAAFDVNNNLLGYLEKTGVQYTDGGSATLSGTWQPPQTFTATLTNLDPTMIRNVNVQRFNNDRFGFSAFASPPNGVMSSVTMSTPAPPSSGKALVEVNVFDMAAGRQQIYQPTAGNSFTYNFDVAAHLLPWVSNPSLDVATGTITVPQTGTGDPDFALTQVSYGRTGTAPDAGQTFTSFAWTVIAPNFDNPIKLPVLPVEVGDVNPKSTDSINGFNVAAMADLDTITSYDQARNDVIGLANAATNGRTDATLVRISQTQLQK